MLCLRPHAFSPHVFHPPHHMRRLLPSHYYLALLPPLSGHLPHGTPGCQRSQPPPGAPPLNYTQDVALDRNDGFAAIQTSFNCCKMVYITYSFRCTKSWLQTGQPHHTTLDLEYSGPPLIRSLSREGTPQESSLFYDQLQYINTILLPSPKTTPLVWPPFLCFRGGLIVGGPHHTTW